MKRVSRMLTTVAAILALSAGLPSAIAAQSIWVDPSLEKAAWLEVLHPDFEDGDGVNFTTSALFLGLRAPVSRNLAFVAELPFGYADFDADAEFEFDGTDGAIGNPYLGIEWNRAASPLWIEAGVRVPITPEENFGTVVGLLTDFVGRAEAFLPDVVPVTGMVNYQIRDDSGLMVRLRGGPSVWIPTDGAETELLAGYSAQLWYEARRFSLGGGYAGRALLTEDGSFGERTVNQLAAGANLRLGQFVPGLQFRLPLDDDDGMDYVVGLNLGLRLR